MGTPRRTSQTGSTKMQYPVDPHRTVPMKEVVFPADDGSFPAFAEPGSVDKETFGPDFWLISCPGCGYVSGLRVGNPKPNKEGAFAIIDDGTLHPTIKCVACCAWHGYLTKKVFKPC